MARLTKEQWAQARIQWESDPMITFDALSKQLGCSHAAVGQMAKKQNWQRDPDMRGIASRAQMKADSRELAKLSPESLGESFAESFKKTGIESFAARELAEDIRADVIERHRADWASHRELFRLSDIAADFNMGKSAKISAEMLALRQKAERAAYGLDESTSSETIEIVRSYGAKPDADKSEHL
jgi:hypothetical protein